MTAKRWTMPEAALTLLVGIVAALAAGIGFFLFPEPFTLEGDNRYIIFPLNLAVFESWSIGRLPIWSDRLFGGFPILADPVSGAFYPFHAVAFLLTPPPHLRAFDVATALHMGLLAAGFFKLLRELDASRPAAIFAAGLTLVSPQLHYWSAYFLPMTSALAWWPWLAVAAERLSNPRRSAGRAWVLGSGAIAAQVLVGYPEFALYSGCIAGFWVLLSDELRLRVRVVRIALLGVGAFCLAAPQILPSVAELRETVRAERLEGADLLAMSLGEPLRYLDPTRPQPPGRIGFVGAGTSVLVACAFLGPARRRFFLGGLAAVAFVLSLGRETPLYPLLSAAPPFSLFRGPFKFFTVVDFCLITMAALGFGVLMRRSGRRAAWVVGICALSLLAATERGAASASHHRRNYEDPQPIDVLLRGTREKLLPAMARLSGDPPPRVYVAQKPGRRLEMPADNFGNLGIVLGLDTLNGGPMALLAERQRRLVLPPLSLDHLDLFGVDFVYRRGPCLPDVTPAAGLAVLEDSEDACVQLNPKRPQRYGLIAGARAVDSIEELEELARNDPAGPTPVQAPARELKRRTRSVPPAGSIRVARYEPGAIELRVSSSVDALMLVRHSWRPGWRAASNGASLPIYRAAGLFFAVPVQAGRSEISLSYHQPGLRAGLSFAAIWIAIAAVALFQRGEKTPLDRMGGELEAGKANAPRAV